MSNADLLALEKTLELHKNHTKKLVEQLQGQINDLTKDLAEEKEKAKEAEDALNKNKNQFNLHKLKATLGTNLGGKVT